MLNLILSSCGFHLRGMIDMPSWLNHVAVIVEQANSSVGTDIVKYFHSYHVDACLGQPGTAKFWLIIEQDKFEERIVSVSSSTTPRQYELIYTVIFKLVKAKGQEIIPSSKIIVNRQATINSNRILGSTQEEELLKNEIRRDAAIQIINRISHESFR